MAAAAGRAGRPAERGILWATTAAAEGKGRPGGGSHRSCSCAAGPRRDLPTMSVAGVFWLFLSLGECRRGALRLRPSGSWTGKRRGAAG